MVSEGDASVFVREAEAIARPFVKVWSNPLDAREPIPAFDLMAARVEASATSAYAVRDIKKASQSFPRRTASMCGWHPQHFACWSDPAVAALATVLRCSLIAGDVPPLCRRLLMPVLTQPNGTAASGQAVGKPGITGIFPCLRRLRGKLL